MSAIISRTRKNERFGEDGDVVLESFSGDVDAPDVESQVFRLERLDESAFASLKADVVAGLDGNSGSFAMTCKGSGFYYLEGWRALITALQGALTDNVSLELMVPDEAARNLAHACGVRLIANIHA